MAYTCTDLTLQQTLSPGREFRLDWKTNATEALGLEKFTIRTWYTYEKNGKTFSKEEDSPLTQRTYTGYWHQFTVDEEVIKFSCHVIPVAKEDDGKKKFAGQWSDGVSWNQVYDLPEAPPAPSISYDDTRGGSDLVIELNNTALNLGLYSVRVGFNIVVDGSVYLDTSTIPIQETAYAQLTYRYPVKTGSTYKVRAKYYISPLWSFNDGYWSSRETAWGDFSETISTPPNINYWWQQDSEWFEVDPGSNDKYKYWIIPNYMHMTKEFVSQYPSIAEAHMAMAAKSFANTWFNVTAYNETTVKLTWKAIPTATEYRIRHSNVFDYLTSNLATVESETDELTYFISGLETGVDKNVHWFQLQALNDDYDSDWSNIIGIAIGQTPDAPTTWSNRSSLTTDDTLIFSWIHNSKDNSLCAKSKLQLIVDGEEQEAIIVTGQLDPDNPDQNIIQQYTLDPSTVSGTGCTIEWFVATMGASGAYGRNSISRTVKYYESVTVSTTLYHTDDEDQEPINATTNPLTHWPVTCAINAGPASQIPLSYDISIVNKGVPYDYDLPTGGKRTIMTGEQVYHNYMLSPDPSDTIDISGATLENGRVYELRVSVSMDSGLINDTAIQFKTAYEYRDDYVGIETETYYDTHIAALYVRPYFVDEDGEEDTTIEGYDIDLFRIDASGKPLYVGTADMDSGGQNWIQDKHPTYKWAYYRLGIRDKITNTVEFIQMVPVRIDETSIVIQWNERQALYAATDPSFVPGKNNSEYEQTILKLPYNIDVTEQTNADVSHINYVGREHPVSYYGTHLGYTATWTAVIPKADTETIKLLRQLQTWMGDVYVREPSGTGYWASVSVSFPINHVDMTVTVTLNLTRVDGGA